MDNKLLLELFERIISLEERVSTLESQTEESSDSILSSTTVTRMHARDYVMKRIEDMNPTLNAYKAKRGQGGGIVLETLGTGSKQIIKFYFSKSHSDERVWGWHTIHETHIEDNRFAYYVLAIAHEGDIFTFILNREDMRSFIAGKEHDQHNNYHFYIHQEGDHFIEDRDRKSVVNEFNATKFLDKWSKFSI